VVFKPAIPVTREAEAGGLRVWASPGKVRETLFKKQKEQNERTGKVAQVVQHLPKCETLGSIPSTANNKTKT
jgi:hypothetical protein